MGLLFVFLRRIHRITCTFHCSKQWIHKEAWQIGNGDGRGSELYVMVGASHALWFAGYSTLQHQQQWQHLLLGHGSSMRSRICFMRSWDLLLAVHMGSTFVASVGFFFLRLVKLLSTSDLETYSVFNMHLYELTKYSQESSPWMLKRDILCTIWYPNVCSLKGWGYFTAWTASVIYLLIYTPLSGADEVRV